MTALASAGPPVRESSCLDASENEKSTILSNLFVIKQVKSQGTKHHAYLSMCLLQTVTAIQGMVMETKQHCACKLTILKMKISRK